MPGSGNRDVWMGGSRPLLLKGLEGMTDQGDGPLRVAYVEIGRGRVDVAADDRDDRGRDARARNGNPARVGAAHAGALPLGRNAMALRGLLDRVEETGVHHERAVLHGQGRAAAP